MNEGGTYLTWLGVSFGERRGNIVRRGFVRSLFSRLLLFGVGFEISVAFFPVELRLPIPLRIVSDTNAIWICKLQQREFPVRSSQFFIYFHDFHDYETDSPRQSRNIEIKSIYTQMDGKNDIGTSLHTRAPTRAHPHARTHTRAPTRTPTHARAGIIKLSTFLTESLNTLTM